MRNAALDQLIWVLIYGGLLLAALGWFVRRALAGVGSTLITAGLVLAALGALLIWVRSRRPPD